MRLFSFFKKKKYPKADKRKTYEVQCDVIFKNIVVHKNRFTIKANSKFEAKRMVRETIKIIPKRAIKYNPYTPNKR